ncbi:RNA polymerase sigma factor [uncultured Winogradskyella sp.]|uniref:RNA polymerase sigma factor n=1 Tax=uncultured Winogradskyella sp. TaxID=395353 RepID=UPI0030DDB5D5
MDKVLNGDSKALDKLVDIHQAFIYNVAWKMTHSNEDALDLTQEVLIKVITKLSTFKKKSAFRTWLYRIVFNEFLRSKRKAKEEAFPSFEEHDRQLNAVPDPELTPAEELELNDYTREVKFRCTSAMLICLDREQRLIYLLGESFGINHNLGAEIFSISPQNFRVKLSRARKELHNYMEYRCGLINKANPCRCVKKAKSALKMGVLNENNMILKPSYTKQIGDFVSENQDEMIEVLDQKYVEIFRDHPSKSEFDAETVINKIVNDQTIKNLFNI